MPNPFSKLNTLFRRQPVLKKHTIEEMKADMEIQEMENIEIRDRLAIERTKFANERTFLAYIRTSLALMISGLTFLEFFDNNIFKWIGGIFIPFGIIIGFFGLYRFRVKKEKIRHNKNDYVPTSPIHAQVAEEEQKEQASGEEKQPGV